MASEVRGLTFRKSLRSRFLVGLGAVLLPFLVAAWVGHFYLLPSLLDPMDDIVRELVEEQAPAMRLQATLLQTAMPVNDYLMTGDPDDRLRFVHRRKLAERAFDATPPTQFTRAEERALIVSARAEWIKAQRLGEQILQLPRPIGNVAAAQDMKRFDAHLERAVTSLEDLHQYFRAVIDENLVRAAASRTKALWTALGAFVLAIAISLFAGVALTRSVAGPVKTLRQSVARFSLGELSHRVAIQRSDELGELATAFNAMASALEKNQTELTELATLDGLTGLYNHRTFYILLRGELARAQRFNRPVSLLLLDIDHFKSVNDTHGHQAGDAILQDLGRLLTQASREIDRICRYGGEEITIILPETDVDAAVVIAERMRASVEGHAFEVGGGASMHLTVSVGVASWPLHASNAQGLVAEADTAMYAAKQGGRNRVVRYEPTFGAGA